MKSKVFVGICLLPLAMSACADFPESPDDGTDEDGATDDHSGGRGESGGSVGDGGSGGSGGSGSESDSGGAPSDDGGLSSDGGSSDDGGSGGTNGDGGTGGTNGDGGTGGTNGDGGTGGTSGDGGTGGTSGDGGASADGGTSSDGGTGGEVGASGGSIGEGGFGGEIGSGGSSSDGGSGGADELDPEQLFLAEEFGGNGRTCSTCHTAETGAIAPAQIQALYASDPDGPLFRPIDSDDGDSDDYSLLLERATFRVEIDLPADVFLSADPGAPSVVLRRSVPTTKNTPALDSTLMWDGRAPDLLEQALGAILGHAEATITPTLAELELIAEFEQGYDFFSSDVLRQYAQGGPAPSWPPGNTAVEVRGRRWFAQDTSGNVFAARFNICGQCHGGPMTNETQTNSGLPIGEHFQTVNVSEFNTLGNPTFEFVFPDPENPDETVTVVTPDPGRALITGDVRDINFFKIPPLWGVKETAPYFHDNSAATLQDLMDHYEDHLATFLPSGFGFPFAHVPTAQDKADIIAYMLLL